MVSFFADRNIPLEMTDKESGLIVTKEVKIPYKGFLYQSDYCDCGSLRGLYVYHLILGKFNVTAKELKDIKTSVQVNTEYRASQWLGYSFIGLVACRSKGYMEKIFFKVLDSSLEDLEED